MATQTAPATNGVDASQAYPSYDQGAAPAAGAGPQHTTASNIAPTTNGSAEPAAAPAAPEMSASEKKKFEKLLKKEQKDEEKSMSHALGDAKSTEKAAAKAKKAEQQAIKRLNKCAKEEHKANKKFERAQTAHAKVVADKERLSKELEIKKTNTQTTAQAYERAKLNVDSTRKTNASHAQTRAQKQSEVGL